MEKEIVWLDDTRACEGPATDKLLSIDNVADMFAISRLTLRYYELRGLIRRRHTVGRMRVYGWADCDRIAFIIKCRRAGLRLSEIKPIIEAAEEDVPTGILESGQERCMDLIERLEREKKACNEALAELLHANSLLASKLGIESTGANPPR